MRQIPQTQIKALREPTVSTIRIRVIAVSRETLISKGRNNMPDPSEMSQDELDIWSDINNPNNDADMDDWADAHNPNNDDYLSDDE